MSCGLGVILRLETTGRIQLAMGRYVNMTLARLTIKYFVWLEWGACSYVYLVCNTSL
jgi:hypothetical protein